MTRSTTASGVGAAGGAAVYESSKAVDEYIQFHFGEDIDILPFGKDIAPTNALQFPRRLAELCSTNAGTLNRALDIGCAVGGASFHLSSSFNEVVGIDFSHAFIDAANKMKQVQECKFTCVIQGNITQEKLAKVNSNANVDRCTFEQGDACNIRSDIGTFDAILAANLLCRLPEPRDFLYRLPSLVTKTGVVVLVSPYSWLEEYTEKSKWVGAESELSADVVKSIMQGNNFELVSESNVPFLIREHERKYQWGCSHATIWRLKN